MNRLLSRILDAHGGVDRWRDYEKVEATIVAGGGFYPLKGMIQAATPCRLTAWLPWDPLHRAYFDGEALWTYFTTPFLLAKAGVYVEEVEPWPEDAETWRVLRAQFPGSIETHSLIQDFFFDSDLKLRRHDYSLNIAGGFPAAQLTSDYVVADGIHLPSKRRAYTRGPDRKPITEMLMVSIDISDVQFKRVQVPSTEETIALSTR